MGSFEDTDGDGIGEVPEKYASPEGRKVVEDSKKLGDLLKNPNKYFFMIIGVILVFIILIILMILFVRKVIRRIKKR